MGTIAWLLPTLVSVIGCLWGWRMVFRFFYHEFSYSWDWMDVCASVFFSTMMCWLWPAFLLGVGLRQAVGAKDPREFGQRLAGLSRAEKLALREKRVREREARLRKMERELDLA